MTLESTSSPLLERLFSEEEARIPATFEEYLEVSDESDFKMEYSNGHIVLLEFPTATHEQICATIAWTFGDLFSDEDPFSGYGGNLLFYLQATGNGYKPDVSILNAPPEFICHKSGEKTF
ncbi:MAG: Uma2 family endonuclease, partial [Bacteroidota bacterium]